jgi:hypothetical protein
MGFADCGDDDARRPMFGSVLQNIMKSTLISQKYDFFLGS